MTPEHARERSDTIAEHCTKLGMAEVRPKVSTKYAWPREAQSRAIVLAEGRCVWTCTTDGVEKFYDERLEAAAKDET